MRYLSPWVECAGPLICHYLGRRADSKQIFRSALRLVERLAEKLQVRWLTGIDQVETKWKAAELGREPTVMDRNLVRVR
jgi:hypothetical protein